MAIIKVVEVMSSSPSSWEDAAKQAVSEAARTLRNVRSFYVKEFSTVINSGNIAEYRVTGKLSFELESDEQQS